MNALTPDVPGAHAVKHTGAGLPANDILPGPLVLEWHEAAELTEVLARWRELYDTLQRGQALSCSPEWVTTWLEQYGSRIPYRFVSGRDADGRLRAMTLLTEGIDQYDGPFPLRTLHLGTAGEPAEDSVCVEYNSVLADPPWHAAFLRDLLAAVTADSSWDELRFDGFALDDFAIAEKAIHRLRLRSDVRTVDSWYFDLDTTRAEGLSVIDALGYSTRKHLRRNLRWYGEAGGEPVGQWAETVEEAEDIFNELIALHQARWNSAGKPGSYASAPFTNFHRELLRKLVPEGRMVLYRVTCGDETVGCVQLLVDGRRVLSYQSGFAPYADRRSPGLVVDALCIEECLQRGYAAYDFLGGESEHKQKLSTDRRSLVWARLKRSRLKYVVARAGRLLKHGSRATTPPSATGSVAVREVTSLQGLEDLKDDWDRLLAETTGGTWLQSYDWFTTHRRLYCRSTGMRVLVVEDAGRPIGIVPLVLKSVPTSLGEIACLTWPTDDWGSFYGPVTADPTFVLIHALQYLRWAPRDWDVLELRNVDLDGLDRGRTKTAIEACSMTSHESVWDEAAIVELNRAKGEFTASLPKFQRQKLARTASRLEQRGPLEFVHCRAGAKDAEQLRELYAECEQVASRSWQAGSTSGISVCQPHARGFLQTIHEVAVAAGAADMALLRLNGEPIAFICGVQHNGHGVLLQTGREAGDELAGAGELVMSRWLDSCARLGDRVVDLGVGSPETKRPWITRPAQSYRYTKFSTLSPRAQLLTWSSWLKSNVRQAMTLAADSRNSQEATEQEQPAAGVPAESAAGTPAETVAHGDDGGAKPLARAGK